MWPSVEINEKDGCKMNGLLHQTEQETNDVLARAGQVKKEESKESVLPKGNVIE